MATSYPISLAGLKAPMSITIGTRNVVGFEASPHSLVGQSYEWAGKLLYARVSCPPMLRADAEALIGALVSLRGKRGSLLLGDSANLTPRGIGTGTPLVAGGGQSGEDLVTDGWTAGQTGIMKAGDWFQLGSGSTARLYKVTADVNSDGSGNATLNIYPNLRGSPADNAPLTVSSPRGRFMLMEDVEWSIDQAKIYGLDFSVMEDLRP